MLVKIFLKISILLEIVDQVGFPRNIRKITILVEIFENLDFGRNFRKISISDEIFLKISILLKICEKSRIWSNISKNLDFGRIS